MSRKDGLVRRFELICSNVIIEECPTNVELWGDVGVMMVLWLLVLNPL